MEEIFNICPYTPSSVAGDVFSVSLHTSPVYFDKRFEDSEGFLNDYRKEFQTLTKNLQVMEFYMGALR